MLFVRRGWRKQLSVPYHRVKRLELRYVSDVGTNLLNFQYPTTGSNDWNQSRASSDCYAFRLSVPYHRVKRLERPDLFSDVPGILDFQYPTTGSNDWNRPQSRRALRPE